VLFGSGWRSSSSSGCWCADCLSGSASCSSPRDRTGLSSRRGGPARRASEVELCSTACSARATRPGFGCHALHDSARVRMPPATSEDSDLGRGGNHARPSASSEATTHHRCATSHVGTPVRRGRRARRPSTQSPYPFEDAGRALVFSVRFDLGPLKSIEIDRILANARRNAANLAAGGGTRSRSRRKRRRLRRRSRRRGERAAAEGRAQAREGAAHRRSEAASRVEVRQRVA
jgi:hypothetical protein